MKPFFALIIIIIATTISAQIPFGGFSTPQAFRDNVPDVIDSSFVLSPIAKSADKNDLDFRLEHRDGRGRMRLYRGDIRVFADGENYYVTEGTHSLGAPRFRKLYRCEHGRFSYFRSVSAAPTGHSEHSSSGLIETWLILDSDGTTVTELTDRTLRQHLLRMQPLLYNEYSDRNTRNGTLIDYLRRICD